MGVQYGAAPVAVGAGKLPDITLGMGQSLYIHLTYDCCACGSDRAELYVGTKDNHDKLIATAELRNPCCNYCGRCGCSCICDTPIPILSSSGDPVGLLNLSRRCSCCWCLPYMEVTFNGAQVGAMRTVCCLFCDTCRKDVEKNTVPVYSSMKCIQNKVCSCLLPCIYCPYRVFCTNRSTVEHYTMSSNPDQPAFEVINVPSRYHELWIGCRMLLVLRMWLHQAFRGGRARRKRSRHLQG